MSFASNWGTRGRGAEGSARGRHFVAHDKTTLARLAMRAETRGPDGAQSGQNGRACRVRLGATIFGNPKALAQGSPRRRPHAGEDVDKFSYLLVISRCPSLYI